MKKRKLKGFILLGFLISIIIFNLIIISGAEASASLNFKGEWYSKGFSSVSLWKSFVNQFVSTVFKFEVINDNGNVKFGLKDDSGKQYVFDSYVKYDNETGELSYSTNQGIPNLDIKEISYKIKLNGETDLRKVINPEDYFGKTIGDITKDVLSKGMKIQFAGVRSNITLTANKDFTMSNPIIDVNYQKNIDENYTSLITEESSEEPGLNNTLNSNLTTNSSVNSLNVSKLNAGDSLAENNSETVFKIINPKPDLEEISMFVNETKLFSIENSKNDSIKWYLNGKLMKKDIKSYSFKGLKKGDYNLSVEVELNSETLEHVWKVKVKPLENPEKSNSLIIWIVAGAGFIVFWAGIIYYLKKQGKIKDPQTTLS